MDLTVRQFYFVLLAFFLVIFFFRLFRGKGPWRSVRTAFWLTTGLAWILAGYGGLGEPLRTHPVISPNSNWYKWQMVVPLTLVSAGLLVFTLINWVAGWLQKLRFKIPKKQRRAEVVVFHPRSTQARSRLRHFSEVLLVNILALTLIAILFPQFRRWYWRLRGKERGYAV